MLDSGWTTAIETKDIDPKDFDSKNDEGFFKPNAPLPTGPVVVRLYNIRPQLPTEPGARTDEDASDADCNPHKTESTDTETAKMFEASISDGEHFCNGAVWQTKDGRLEGLSECILSVSGFVLGVNLAPSVPPHLRALPPLPCFRSRTTKCESGCDCNRDELETRDRTNEPTDAPGRTPNAERQYHSPYIYITRYEILYAKGSGDHKDDKKDSATKIQRKCVRIRCQANKHQKEGRLASLLSSDKLGMDVFIGEDRGRLIPHSGYRDWLAARVDEDALEAANFMEQHAAIMALKKTKEKASLVSSSSFSLMLGSLKYFQNYDSAMNEFDRMQRENQYASMQDMAEESGSDGFAEHAEETEDTRREQGWIQTKETLEYAVRCKDETLSPELLLRWHAWLLGDGLEQEAGTFRSETMSKRVGALCAALEDHWLPNIRKDPANAVRIAAFAAAAVMGILNLLPFKAGNQRLARILLNWSLRRAGLPFCIILYSCRGEKLEYHASIESTRQNFFLVPRGGVDDHDMTRILQTTSGLTPLVAYLLSRIARAATELCRLVEQKSLMASTESEARLVRLAREKTATEGFCIICLDDNPNIATLCCGKPVHFNCLAEWLSSNASCPQCRSSLPSLSRSRFSRQGREDPVVDYARDRIMLTDFDLGELTLYHSSSSSSSEESSSSSSSSSPSSSLLSSSSSSSGFFYSGLDIDLGSIASENGDESTRGIRNLLPYRSNTPTPGQGFTDYNHISTDEEDQHDYLSDNDDESSTNDIDRTETVNDGVIYALNVESTRESRFRAHERESLFQLCEDNAANNENHSDNEYDIFLANEDTGSFQGFSVHSPQPPMPFLDPEVLPVQQNRISAIQNFQSTRRGGY